jgi:mannitol/fructose-specific phosphotransferase system IIA component (Ntr-type)
MKLLDILNPASIKAPLSSTDKRGVINELVDLLARPADGSASRITDAQALKDAVWARETTRTTGIGHGLAIPHGKCGGVTDLAMAIGKPAVPIDFAAIDEKPVSLVVLLASPTDRTTDHIQALAKVSRLILMQDFREAIYNATSAEEIYRLLKQHDA